MPDTFIGKTIGGFMLTLQIGIGGAGTVYLAQSADGRQVAIKILTIPAGLSPEQQVELRKRFLREAQVMQSLHHPHILPVESVADDDTLQVTYMIMPYIASGTLATRIVSGPLAFAATVDYITQIAQALDYAHRQNIIHRDIKLANVLVDENNQVFLADFGIVKLFDAMNTTLTNMNQIIGTPGYMSPEQIKSEVVSPATDVYSLSIVAYELLTGKVPFESTTIFSIMQKIATEPPPSPRIARPDLPLPAEAVILRGLAKDPAQRFASAGAFAAALAQGMQNTWPAGIQPAPTPPFVATPGIPPTIATPIIPPTISAPPASIPPYAPRGNASYPPAGYASYPPGGASYPPNAPTGPMPIVTRTPPPRNANNRGLITAVVALVAAIVLVAIVVGIVIAKPPINSNTGFTPPATTFPDTATIPTASPTGMPATLTPTLTPAPIITVTSAPIVSDVCPSGFSDTFAGPTFQQPWSKGIIYEPDTISLSDNPGYLTITSYGPNKDLTGSNNTAPQLLQYVGGNAIMGLEIDSIAIRPYERAGLLVWEDDNHFIRLQVVTGSVIFEVWHSHHLEQQIYTNFTGASVRVRVRRNGDVFVAEWQSIGSSQWSTAGSTTFPSSPSTLLAGPFVVNDQGSVTGTSTTARGYFKQFTVNCPPS